MNTVQLRIIAKTSMNNGFCYIGLYQNTLVRPIPRTTESECCWPNDHVQFKVGEFHNFQVLDSDPHVAHPHKVNDVLVKHLGRAESPQDLNLFGVLRALSHERLMDVFGGIKLIDDRYVEEGSMCPSVGIYRCHRENISVRRNDKGKQRCEITDNGHVFDFPINAVSGGERIGNDGEVLLVLGMGRPLSGKENYNPRRCFVLVIGIVSETNTIQLPIVAKKRTSDGFFYIGLNGKRLIWPLPQDWCGWPYDYFEVGEVHNFEVLDVEAETSHPHKCDEVLVQHRARMLGVEPAQNDNLFHMLHPLRHERIRDVFPVLPIEKKYVTEGTHCPSIGIYSCEGRDIWCFKNKFSGKDRCQISEGNCIVDFPACIENGAIGKIEENDEVLLILALSRPFAGRQKNFDPRRCHATVMGIVTQEKQQ